VVVVNWLNGSSGADAPGASRPARDANLRNNAVADEGRAVRWRPARDALWRVVDPLLPEGGRVVIVGAGNGDDIPLTRLAARAARVDLYDIDGAAARSAVAGEPEALRERCRAIEDDVTGGAADAIAVAAASGAMPEELPAPDGPLGDGDYDLVIGDLLYTQILFPALLALGLTIEERARYLTQYGARVTQAIVGRLHDSAPNGSVVHVHDLVCWAPGHGQPVTLDEVLARPRELLTGLLQPAGCDPEPEIDAVGARIEQTHWWRWPYGEGIDYLVRANVAVRDQ
jgi:hypothetical protein